MLKKLDDCEECGQDHINAEASTGREKMLLHLSLFSEHGSQEKWNLSNIFVKCNAFDMQVL